MRNRKHYGPLKPRNPLTTEDKVILDALGPVVEAIAEAFGNNCEVVLHSFEDLNHSIIKIVNGHVTGRKVGSPFDGLGSPPVGSNMERYIEIYESSENDVIGSYYIKLHNGKLLRSNGALVRNAEGKPIGELCINVDLSASLISFIKEFVPGGSDPSKHAIERFPLTLEELVSATLESVITRMNSYREGSPLEKNKAIVTELHRRGMFKVQGAIDIVAKRMGVSRYTVYNYIREAKIKNIEA